jgi:regulator of replication initiation timing
VEELEAARQEARAELSEARATAEARSEEIDRLEAENEQLSSELSDLRAERDQLQSEVSDLESEVSDLEAEVSDLRDQLAELEAQQPDGDHEVTAPKALSGTNLFVRYDAKSGPTLETAHAETATRAEVEDNLRIETHTDFEKEGAIVEDQTYPEFLQSTIEFNFVDWVVHELLYELQETGAEGKLRDLYDAIPKVDRAELHGVVEIYDEAAEVDTERPFDVILRDRMGDPLVVANVMDTRDATMEPEVDELVSDAHDVAQHRDSLGCAAYVTTSFFHPRALESATEETGGGLLSRNKRASYVKLGRKQGFHLALVESREEGFHFTLPEL